LHWCAGNTNPEKCTKYIQFCSACDECNPSPKSVQAFLRPFTNTTVNASADANLLSSASALGSCTTFVLVALLFTWGSFEFCY
jgi:hypothetical protein